MRLPLEERPWGSVSQTPGALDPRSQGHGNQTKGHQEDHSLAEEIDEEGRQAIAEEGHPPQNQAIGACASAELLREAEREARRKRYDEKGRLALQAGLILARLAG